MRPALIAADVDLLVKPVWSSDGANLVFRRSAPAAEGAGDFRLVSIELATGTERELVFSSGVAVFPVAFAPDGKRLFYVRVGTNASDLFVIDVASGEQHEAGRLADGLTRDWALSPTGDRLAYLEMTFADGQILSRAYVLDIATAVRRPASDARGDNYSPIWSARGDLALGQAGGATSGVTTFRGSETFTLAGPARGFDVPLAWSPADDGLAVRSFDGSSAMAPGGAALTVVRPDGRRTTIASGEVTFLGWTNP